MAGSMRDYKGGVEPTSDSEKASDGGVVRGTSIVTAEGEIVNASGHRDQLQRHYGLVSICGLALVVDNPWAAIGSSVQVSIGSGGPAGVLYEFIIAAFYYAFIAASIAELASAIPSSAGVYHWASTLAGPRAGRVLGFFTGSINFFGWIFDLAAIAYVMGNISVQMYALFHPDLEIQAWQIFVASTITVVLCALCTIFLNRFMPYFNQFGLFMVTVGGVVTIIVLAAMPKQHASTESVFIWNEENNVTGWGSGVAFLIGVLNGAFAIGTPDGVTHMAEELPNPKRDLPRAVCAQIGLGTIYAFLFGVVLFYGINDLDAVVNAPGSLPLAEAYAQATGSTAATFGLLLIVFLSSIPCLIGTFLTVGRTWWALARDNATPFAKFFSHVNEDLSCPVAATVFTAVLTIGFTAITLGSKTAFQSLTGSFIILSSISYLLAILPNIITRRRYMPEGDFRMPDAVAYFVNGCACVFIVFFDIIFCFPPVNPTDANTMSYNSVILVGVVLLTTFWWVIHGMRKYAGPKMAGMALIEGQVREKPTESALAQ